MLLWLRSSSLFSLTLLKAENQQRRVGPGRDCDQDRGLFEMAEGIIILFSSLYTQRKASKFGPESWRRHRLLWGELPRHYLFFPSLNLSVHMDQQGSILFCWHPWDSHPGLPSFEWGHQLSDLLWVLPFSKLTWPTVGYSFQVQLSVQQSNQ